MPVSPQSDDLDVPIWTDDEILGFLDHDAPPVRLWALKRLGGVGEEEKLHDAVIRCLRDDNRLVAQAAVRTVPEVSDEIPPELLRSCASREDLSVEVRGLAVSLLAGRGEEWAQEEMLDAYESREEEAAYRPGRWAGRDPEGFVRAVQQRWGETGLPINYGLLQPIMSQGLTELAGAVVDVMVRADDPWACELLEDAVAHATGRYEEFPDLDHILEAGISLEKESPEFPFVPMPDLETELEEAEQRLCSHMEEKIWEGATDTLLGEVLVLGQYFEEEMTELEDLAWGLALARAWREISPPVDQPRFLLRAAYELFRGMLVTAAIERTCRRSSDLRPLLESVEYANEEEMPRLRGRITDRWQRAMEDGTPPDQMVQEIDAWLDAESGVAYVGKLWMVSGLDACPLRRRVEDLCEVVQEGRIEGEELETSAVLIGNYLTLHPELLRRRAPALLRTHPQLARETIDALTCHNRKWASRILLENLDHILILPGGNRVWNSLYRLGDPEALERAVEEWRPGEGTITGCAAHLARLKGSYENLPPEIRREAAEEEKLTQQSLAQMEDVDARETFTRLMGEALWLPARCTECGRTYTYEVERAYVDPDALDDGDADLLEHVVLARIIHCKNCGAEDCYELTEEAHIPLLGGFLMAERSDNMQEMPVVPMRPQLVDGSPVRTASQAIGHLQDMVDENPESAEARRRLGNICEKFGEPEKAEEAWREAIRLDETDVESAFSLAAMLWDRPEDAEGAHFALEAIERFPRAEMPDGLRQAIARNLVDMLQGISEAARPPLAMEAAWIEELPDQTAGINLSKVDLRRIRQWDRLEDLLIEDRFEEIRFTHEMPEESPTLLEKFINRTRSAAPSIPLFGGPLSGPMPPDEPFSGGDEKVGRNDPCPCGSGRKYKHCCGRSGREL